MSRTEPNRKDGHHAGIRVSHGVPVGRASLVGRIYRNLDDLVTPQPAVRDGCVFPDHAKAVYAALQGPKQIEWTEGSQIDFYDLEPQVSMAVALAVPHFSSTLGDD